MDKKTKDALMNLAAEIVVAPLRIYAAGREAYQKLEESGKIDEAKDKFEEFKNSDQVKQAKEKFDSFTEKAKEFGDNALDKAKEFGDAAGVKFHKIVICTFCRLVICIALSFAIRNVSVQVTEIIQHIELTIKDIPFDSP